ncbi:recombination protein NinB [Stenotrophomonas rhizophila]
MLGTFILRSADARDRMASAWHFACQFLELGQEVQVTVKQYEPARSREQNAMFHAICGELSKQKQWAGRWIDTEGWKRLLVDAWARETDRQQGDVVPSLDGVSIVNLAMQTRRLRVKEMADLITFAQWWATDNDVKLREVAPLRDQRLAAQAREAA